MSERTQSKTVNFMHPFQLRGMDEEQPAGAYRIEIVDERLETLDMVAYRRVSTAIMLPSILTNALARESVAIDPADLELALKRDAADS